MMDGGRIVCIVLQAEPVALVKRAHGRAAHGFSSSSSAHGAYLFVPVEAGFRSEFACRLAIFQIQEKKVANHAHHTSRTWVFGSPCHFFSCRFACLFAAYSFFFSSLGMRYV